MAIEIPLRDRILDATVDVLQRHGAEKTNVVDVADKLGMSPGNIYRFFSSKKELLEAVAVRWVDECTVPIEAVAADRARPAIERLTAWFDLLRKFKRRKLIDEPELFRVYLDIVGSARKTTEEHIKMLLGQLERILSDGKKNGEFSRAIDTKSAALAFLNATARFHHPAMVVQHPGATEAEAKAVLKILIAGLRSG